MKTYSVYLLVILGCLSDQTLAEDTTTQQVVYCPGVNSCPGEVYYVEQRSCFVCYPGYEGDVCAILPSGLLPGYSTCKITRWPPLNCRDVEDSLGKCSYILPDTLNDVKGGKPEPKVNVDINVNVNN